MVCNFILIVALGMFTTQADGDPEAFLPLHLQCCDMDARMPNTSDQSASTNATPINPPLTAQTVTQAGEAPIP